MGRCEKGNAPCVIYGELLETANVIEATRSRPEIGNTLRCKEEL
jgi:hypothetical protein